MASYVRSVRAEYKCFICNFHKGADCTLIECLTGHRYDEVAIDARLLVQAACGGLFRTIGAPISMDILRHLGLPREAEWVALKRSAVEDLSPEEGNPHRARAMRQKCTLGRLFRGRDAHKNGGP